LMLSVWQFLQNERLRARIQPWEYAGLQVEDVDPGDYLLDWRRGGHGLRYVHHFDQAELQELAAGSGFAIQTSFKSDGQGGQLSLYQIWNKPAKPPVNF
jgi:tRNA (uracil-5-)-methyltransferase TRM9